MGRFGPLGYGEGVGDCFSGGGEEDCGDGVGFLAVWAHGRRGGAVVVLELG